jgi:uncharacterized protein (DUF342 family)
MGGDHDSPAGVRIEVSPDHQTATLVIEPGIDPARLGAEVIDAQAADRGIVGSSERARIIREAIDAYAEHEGTEPFERVIARGRPPQHGADGHIEFEPGLDPNEPPGEPEAPTDRADPNEDADADDAIDYYSQSAFTVVSPGQLIGRLVEPTEGVDGFDVLGKALAAKAGRAYEVKTDESVVLDRDLRLVAQRSGIIEFTGSRLRVLDELHIDANVDFSTGNIAFPGNVTVAVGVKDRFKVRVGGSLVVRELVEAASLTAAVDCTLHRGMAARGKGSLKTGRDLSANYLDNTTVIVGRDLHVLKEIASCTTTVSRRVESDCAALIGGILTVGSTCRLGQVGSEAGVRTTLVLGRIKEIDDLAERLVALRPDYITRAARGRHRLETLAAAGSNLSPEQVEEAARLQAATSEAETGLTRIREAMERLWNTHQENTAAELIVSKMMYAGTVLHLGGRRVRITQDLIGPVELRLDAEGAPTLVEGGKQPPRSLEEVAEVEESERHPDLRALIEPPDPTARAA